MEDDIIDWDDQHPPSMGEERIQRMSCLIDIHVIIILACTFLWPN